MWPSWGAERLPSRPKLKLAAAAMLVGLDHRLDENIAQRGKGKTDGDASERHRLQDRPKLVQRRLENAVGKVDAMLRDMPAEHQIAGLVGRVPQQRISQRIAEESAEHCGDDAAADRPCDQGGHDHVGAEEGRSRGKYADRETESDGMRRVAQAPQAI